MVHQSQCLKELENFEPGAALTFFVGWRSGKSIGLGKIGLHKDIAQQFRRIAVQTIERLNELNEEPWSPEAELSPEVFLSGSIDMVGGSPTLVNRPSELLLPALRRAEELDTVSHRNVEVKQLSFYGFAIGAIGNRTVFIRRVNPRRGLKGGKFFGLFSDDLRSIEEPIFAFDEMIDLVVLESKLVILSQIAFAKLFRENDELLAMVPKWAESLGQQCPIEQSTLEIIADRSLKDSRLRQRLESISTRGHLSDVGNDEIQSAMVNLGFDPDDYFNSDHKLEVDEDKVPDLLNFLNEDLFSGALSGTGFRADRKAARQ